MRRSKAEVYPHLVWATHSRQPWLTPEITPPVYGCIVSMAERHGCSVLAVGGMPDHVHPAVRLPPRTSISHLVQQVKGASSHLAAELLGRDISFRWQEGYAVFSLGRLDMPKVVAYIEQQERRHAAGKLWQNWEETDEEAPTM